MLLIVGLGNPGPRYAETPHNAGFAVCDRFVARHRIGPAAAKFQGEFARGKALGQDVAVLKPQTFMNLSGESVSAALRYLPIAPGEVVVVFDEMDIPSGKLRLRRSGGHGGHNGLRSIIDALGSSDFPRMRVGVGRPAEGREPTGHLLGKPRADERARLSATIELAVDALDAVISDGFEAAMNRFNGLEPVGTEPAG
ncbi:MAG: aminoacyl-tRNA hydrolase [Myxococcota bacterium]